MYTDSDCQSDTAKDRRKVFTNKCSLKGCKKKEVIPVVCNECTLNYCLKHRHPSDHKCEGKVAARRQRQLYVIHLNFANHSDIYRLFQREAAVSRQAHKNIPQSNTFHSSVQGNMVKEIS